MYSEYEIRQMPLTIARYRQQVERFLAQNELRLDDMDYYAGVFRLGDEQLLAGGGLKGGTIKCIAVDGSLRDEGMSNRLVSHLTGVARERGYKNVKLFTKPENRAIFESLAFRLLAEAPKAILMETGTGGLDEYVAYLRGKSNRFEEYGKVLSHPYTGVVVMNANPFTNGHYYLLRQASMQVDTLYVIAVKEDRSLFSYAERKAMIEAGTRDLQNVVVLEGSDYAISDATFPTYFLKQLSDASDTQMTLDLDLFARHIAPALGATMRFVGSEPLDSLTARYNQLMREQLMGSGIDVVEIPRLADSRRHPVNATGLRDAIASGSLAEASRNIPTTTLPYIIAHLASRALLAELDATPKPGLVDRHDSGAHHDMDYSLMQLSVKAIHPFFAKIALLGHSGQATAEQLKAIGMEAEKSMFDATNGVNTHKGALFSMGLAVAAASTLLHKGEPLDASRMHETIKRLAADFAATAGTHGDMAARANGNIRGALANAQHGYEALFDCWLPFLSNHTDDQHTIQKTLLLIMSQIDDTNILYRTDANTAAQVKQEALVLLKDYSDDKMEQLNRRYIEKNISPGGAADMLALTIFIHSVLN